LSIRSGSSRRVRLLLFRLLERIASVLILLKISTHSDQRRFDNVTDIIQLFLLGDTCPQLSAMFDKFGLVHHLALELLLYAIELFTDPLTVAGQLGPLFK
jgi:hypothetical protein